MTSEWIFRSVTELEDAIRSRQVSVVEVVDAHLHHIEQYNPLLNAIVTLDADRARDLAQKADEALARGEVWGPLHGVPVTVEDIFETRGMRTTWGMKAFADYVPDHDSPVVARLREAGAIIIGKTNVPAVTLAGDYQSVNRVFGRTNNPWDLGRTAGGSSGGEAAAVAAGLSPLGIGSDAGGSLRQPAHVCGVMALKPTNEIVTFEPTGTGRILNHVVSVGPITRSVADLRLCLGVLAGAHIRSWEGPLHVPVAPAPRQLPDLRFAWTDDLGGMPVTAETRAGMGSLARRLAQAGCVVERCSPPELDVEQARRLQAQFVGYASLGMLPAGYPQRVIWRALSYLVPSRYPCCAAPRLAREEPRRAWWTPLINVTRSWRCWNGFWNTTMPGCARCLRFRRLNTGVRYKN
ncbi:MAG: hypothetical protein JW966_09765 [Anaerolineae bacterium]|nr:hypothetical protein [Anaerolineae bacterium]